MTDTAPETSQPEPDPVWGENQTTPAFPVYPEPVNNPHNHRFTVSMNGQGPMVVVRGSTAEEIREGFDELEESGFGAYVAAFWAGVNAAKNMAQGLGATPAQQAPQAPAQAPQGQYAAPAPYAPQGPTQGPPFGPNVSVPQAPNYQGPPVQQGYQQAPAQQGWGGQRGGGGQSAPQGWYKLNVPYPGGKDQLHALAAQYQIQQGNPGKGMYNFWSAPAKAWYCAPEVAQAFAQFNPMPA